MNAETDAQVFGSCLAILVMFVLAWVVMLVVIDWLKLQDRVDSACANHGGVAIKIGELSFSNAVSYRIECVDGAEERRN